MKVVLIDSNHHLEWGDEWIYIGSNYQKLRFYEDRIAGNRISLCEKIKRQFIKQRKPFLTWVDHQRLNNHDSLYWWMSHLAGRNNMSSQYYSFLCQVLALRNWILVQPSYSKDILVVCEDAYLLQTIRKNIGNICTVISNNSEWIGLLKYTTYELVRSAYTILRQCRRYIYHYWASRKTRPTDLKIPSGEVYLIHQCLDDNSFVGEGKVNCRYFTVLPQWLEQQGKQVVGLAWLYNVNIPIEEVYKKLRASNALIPEDWLRPIDYVWSIISSVRSAFSLKSNIPYDGFNGSFLVLRERLKQLSDDGAHFWRYIPMLKRWGHDLDLLVTYDHYENMLFEHPIRKTLRDFSFRTYSIGFSHALVSREFLGYHSLHEEWSSSVKPDLVVCNGLIGRKILVSQGVPKLRVIDGASLRGSIQPNVNKINKTGDLLILLSLSMDSSMEVLDVMREHADWIAESLNISVRVKPHPMMTRESLLGGMGWGSLPKGWEWEFQEIQPALNQARCCVTLMTASVYDAVLAGCVVLPVKSELQQMDNYLDLFDEEFPEARSVPRGELRERLEDIFVKKVEVFSRAFKMIQKKLADGVNPINDLTLRAFCYEENQQ